MEANTIPHKHLLLYFLTLLEYNFFKRFDSLWPRRVAEYKNNNFSVYCLKNVVLTQIVL